MIASPLRPRHRQEQGIAAAGRLAHPRNALRRFTLVRHHDTPMASSRPALTEAPAAHNQAALGTTRSIPGRALASSMLDSPCQGSRTGFTPPISTSVPSTPDLRSLPLAAIVAGQRRRDPSSQGFKPGVALQHAPAAVLGGPASRSRRHGDLFRSCLHSSSYKPQQRRGDFSRHQCEAGRT